MTVVDFTAARAERDRVRALVASIAHDVVALSETLAGALADEAVGITRALIDPDRQLAHTVEQFVLRRGLRRLGKIMRAEQCQAADPYLKTLKPILARAYRAALDERDPLTCDTPTGPAPLWRVWG